MPWRTDVVESRLYAMELLAEGLSAGQVAEAVGVSRQTIQKWKKRLASEGKRGLLDRSHAPLEHPYEVSRRMEKLVLKARRKYGEGPRKLRFYLGEDYPDERIPAASTIGRILKAHGLTEHRPTQRIHRPSQPSPLTEAKRPNDVWCIDFKGEFEVGGRLCYPFTVTDAFSRYVIATHAGFNTGGKRVYACLWRAFRRFGLPRVIRSDNGPPFVGRNAPRGLSRLSVRWVRLGIQPERIEPGKPQQNGRHERFHKSLKHATANPPATSLPAQQKRFDRYRVHFNDHRPHESLEMKRPAELYTPSERSRPDSVPPIEHPGVQRILCVSGDGRIHFRGNELHLSKALVYETVGITEIHDDLYEVTYGGLLLAHLSYRHPEPRVLTFR